MTYTVPATELTFVEGSSSKFYRTYALERIAYVQYGRIGTYGSWQTKEFPTVEAAAAHAAKQAESKWNKGYQYTKQVVLAFEAPPAEIDLSNALDAAVASAGAAVTTVVDATVAVSAGEAVFPATLIGWGPQPYRPEQPVQTPRAMLAMTADQAKLDLAELLDGHHWIAQFKYDGDRVMIDVIDGVVSVYGRNGQAKQRDVNPTVLAAFANLTVGRWTFDGEMLGGQTLVLFDLIESPMSHSGSQFHSRYSMLTTIVEALDVDPALIVLAPYAKGADDKAAMLAAAQADNREGLIFRDVLAAYTPGRTPALVKHKFVREADCVVVAINEGAKESASLGLFDRTGKITYVGKVTTIGKGALNVGDVVEVRFLYTTDPDAPRLYQPRIIRKRTDKSASECSTDQLIGTTTNKAV